MSRRNPFDRFGRQFPFAPTRRDNPQGGEKLGEIRGAQDPLQAARLAKQLGHVRGQLELGLRIGARRDQQKDYVGGLAIGGVEGNSRLADSDHMDAIGPRRDELQYGR